MLSVNITTTEINDIYQLNPMLLENIDLTEKLNSEQIRFQNMFYFF